MEREYLIYKVTNKINGKIYIGQTHFRNDKYLGSGKIITAAIEKHGRDNFVKEYIDVASCQEDLDEKEKYWIKELNAQDKNIGYNIADGGWNDFTMNEEIKEKISNTLKGKFVGENAFRHGIKLSDEHKAAISKALKGRKKTTAFKKHLSKINKGKKHSKEAKIKMSVSATGRVKSKETIEKIKNSLLARNFHWSEEQKEKIRNSNINKHQKHSKYVDVLDIETGKIETFNNKVQAAKFIGCSRPMIKEGFVKNNFKILKVY